MEHSMNNTNVEATQQVNEGNTKGKQQGRKGNTRGKHTLRSAKVNEVHKQHSYATILVVASSGANVESERFPLYKPFTLSPESADEYIKVNRSTIVHLRTQERFAAEGLGYYTSLQLTNGGK